jgi:glycerophosphoryl diester phosphodiesterase
MTQPLLDTHVPHRTDPATSVVNVAHRGASSSAPENTVAALHHAALAGADRVELDVRRSRDGALVLVHDATLERTTDVRRVFPARGPWQVEAFTLDELRQLDAGSWFGAAYAGTPVATLDDALVHAEQVGMSLLLELKSPQHAPGLVRDVAGALRRHGAVRRIDRPAPSPGVVVQSFDHRSMRRLKAMEPGVPVGLLGAPPARDLAALSAWADQVNPHHLRVDERYVRAVQRHGMECHVWTVNRRASMRRVLGLGVDGVITDRPASLAQELGRRPRSSGRGDHEEAS